MALQDDLLKLVQKASIDGALTPVAVEYVQKLFAENAGIINDRDLHKAKASEYASKLGDSNGKLAALELRLKEIETREAAVAAREKNITTLELTAKHEAQRVLDHKDMVGLVFRNIDVRRNVYTPIAPVQASDNPYQMAQPGYVAENEQTERKL